MPNIAHFMGGIYPGLLKQLFGSDSGSLFIAVFQLPGRSCGAWGVPAWTPTFCRLEGATEPPKWPLAGLVTFL